MKRFAPLSLALLLVAPGAALAKASVSVKCSAPCKIKIDGARGEKVSEQEWLYSEIEEGIHEVEVSRGFEGGWVDVPAAGPVELVVSKEPLQATGGTALDKRAKKRQEKERAEARAREEASRTPEERERIEAEKREKREREKAERGEKDRLEKERQEKEKQDKLDKERAEREAKERLKQERADKERAEREGKEREKQEKVERERAEREAKDRAKAEKDRPRPPESGGGGSAKKVRVAVLKMQARVGIDQALADLYADSLVAELRKRGDLTVTSPTDVNAALGADATKKLMGCSDESCLSEIVGALGVDRLVNGTVGRVGKSLMVNMTLIDARKGTAVSTVSERLKSNSDEAYFDALPQMVEKLVGRR